MGMCPSRGRIGYKMAKQGGTATTTDRESRRTGEISYPVDDEKEGCCTTMSQRSPRRKNKLEKSITEMNRTSGFEERNTPKVGLPNPSPSQNGCV